MLLPRLLLLEPVQLLQVLLVDLVLLEPVQLRPVCIVPSLSCGPPMTLNQNGSEDTPNVPQHVRRENSAFPICRAHRVPVLGREPLGIPLLWWCLLLAVPHEAWCTDMGRMSWAS